MASLGGFLGSMAGMAIDPLFIVFAIVAIIASFNKMFLVVAITFIVTSALHYWVSWSFWVSVAGENAAIKTAISVAAFKIIWTIILIGIGLFMRFIAMKNNTNS